MKKFVKATNSEGIEVYVNLNLVSTIQEEGSVYVLSLFGNKFTVSRDCKAVKDAINEQV